MKTVAVIQARVGSTRLPGKVLKDLCGDTVLARVVNRICRATLLDEVIVATSVEASDDAIVKECRRISVPVFRGSEHDVLDRYYQASRDARAEIVVRITSDCPLIDPEVSDKTIGAFLDVRPDYCSNALKRTYPRGLDTEVMSFSVLECAWREANKRHQREHVTPFIYEHPERFKLLSVAGEQDYSRYRWTLDVPEDLEFLRAIYSRQDGTYLSWEDVLHILDREPALASINELVHQKPVTS